MTAVRPFGHGNQSIATEYRPGLGSNLSKHLHNPSLDHPWWCLHVNDTTSYFSQESAIIGVSHYIRTKIHREFGCETTRTRTRQGATVRSVREGNYPGWDKGAVKTFISDSFRNNILWACFTDCYCKFSKTKLEHIVAEGYAWPQPNFWIATRRDRCQSTARKAFSLSGLCLAQAEV